uniref:glycoside hydrolase family 25 protein n=1 Tax=Pseudonocardia sp. CA-138482 TaxID=3240023 RepID=UPI003F4976F3
MTDDAWRHDELGWLPDAPDDGATPIGDAIEPAVLPHDANAIGIDVSSWQGQPNWAQVAGSGRSFAYIKATEGTDYVSPELDGQYRGARAAGLKVGLYHFADPGLSPEANADAFCAQVNRLGAVPGHLPPCLDLETGVGDLSGWAQRFVTRVRADTACVRVMVYSSASFFQNQITERWMDQNIGVWIAHFGAAPGRPAYLSPRVALHQHSSTGQVAGVTGSVDLDYAIWPLSTIIPGAEAPVTHPPDPGLGNLTAAQDAKLTACFQQLSGSPNVGEWPGWPSWPGGSGRSLTVVDYARQADVEMVALKAELAALRAQVALAPAGGPAALADADITRIATAVAELLASRLRS